MASLRSRMAHFFAPIALRSYLAEFISSFFFVFAAVGATMSTRLVNNAMSTIGRLMPDAASNASSLEVVAIANAFALSVAVYTAANVSGGHVNPAVTFGMAVGGHISIPMGIFYWIAQMLGSVMACLLLKTTTAGQRIPVYTIQGEMTGFGAAILEGVMTFALVYTVYASVDPRTGPMRAIGPLAIGLIAGANVMAAGPFTGGSMNPACSFGAALVGGSFKNHAVYWIGPLIGAAIAGLLYENVVFPSQVPDSDGTF